MNETIVLQQFAGTFNGHHFKGRMGKIVVYGDSWEEVLSLLLQSQKKKP